MKKSTQILGLPVISITEGRELGMSKTLLIDAKNGAVAAITIEDDDWYRGVKLLPYDSVIAVGEDAVTITNSENILTLEDAVDFENLLDENVRIIGTKAITKAGTIQGSVTEIYVGDDGKVVQCEITTPDGTTNDIAADEISIFGKQVTVIDGGSLEKKTSDVMPAAAEPAAEPAYEETSAPVEPETAHETADFEPTPEPEPEPAVEEPPVQEPAIEAEPEPIPEPAADPEDAAEKAAAKATEDRHRRFLLGKKASRTISTDTGVVIVEAGADITEEVLQKAKLANKIIELSMNVQ